ncbi:MAG: bifunctional demethylmenaquinone methyltransferase/2-methoxy-6-polyprenyl-1,4-benzoquinol methylase UbiE [Bacteroidota bacterium]|nr:bifunctional demethylmenaquinone methyltransferase/2-methoxy-6-polyprenyl-1,4-benzoquinol methylase UbiE [Bacteroidota bacterium]
MTVTPYKDTTTGKKQQVTAMFNNIAPKYDFLNHFLSLGIDILWRKKAIGLLKTQNPKQILDIATGTGDFAIEALVLNPDKITGLDISAGMLSVGREKIKNKKLEDKIELILGDSENLPFAEKTFDAITVGFGVRNFENLDKGLSEMFRVLNGGGKVVVLEFSRPKKFPVKQVYNLYFNQILPFIGKIVSKDNTAYTYLPESVNAFPDGQDFLDILSKNGFKETKCISLLFGISSIYTGKK